MKKFFIIIFVFLLSLNIFAQGHFVVAFDGVGQSHMNFNILSATSDNINLTAVDEIAVFDGSICCGKVILEQPIILGDVSTSVTIAASMADDGQSNGYTTGDSITFKFWISATNQELSGITAQYLDENTQEPITAPTFEPFASAFVILSYATPVNHIPVANAGPDQSVNENTLVTLNGTASSDPDNDALTYLWTAPLGITLSSNTASKPTFTAPEVTTNTNYTFSLVVNDGNINSTADQVVITVKQVNKAPVANAGPDQSVNENTLVTLNGTASSDPDNDALTYLWTAPSGITLSSNTASKPTFTSPEVATNTNYTFSLVVNDGMVNSTANQVVITVKQVNKAPVANAGPDQSVNENTLVTLNGLASSDPDNDALTYLWTALSGITLSSNTASNPTFTSPEVATNTNFTFSLVVNDGMVNSTADQVVITVKQVNKAPVANAGSNQSVNENTVVNLNGTASSDADNDALTYLWTAPSGITLSSNTASKPTFTSPEVATNTNYTFSLVVNDGMVNSTANQVVITVKQVNKAPVANAGPDQSVNENTLVTLNGLASSDPDNDALTYLWTALSGITLSSNTASNPTFTSPEVATNTNFTFSLVVNDGMVNSSADQVVITVKQVNKAPVANAGPDQSVNENTVVNLNGTASSDADNDALTYLWTAPSGITLSSNTASKPTFTSPEVATNTNYTFSLVVNDGMVNSTANQVVITVKQVNKAPVANAGPDQSVNENTLVTLNGLASSDPDNDALTYLWTALSGITLSSNTASNPTFTSPEVATNTNFTFSLVVNDGMVNSSADQVVITVKQVNKAPVANAGSNQSVNENTVVNLNGTASSDADNDALTYLWTAPSGITLSSNTASMPTFTAPEVATNTNYTFSLVVNDGMVNSTADQVVITVKQVNKAPVANAGPDQSVNENTVVNLNGTASSDADNDALTYLWTAPSGITLSSNTASKPTFTSPEVATNTNYTFSLVVNDGMVNSSADQVVITVKQVNKAPVANAGPDQSVNENTLVTLNGLASSDPDNDALTYLWTAPSGITLSSNTASKPTFTSPEVATNTNYTFSLVVNDGMVNSSADQVVIMVKQVNKAPVANAGSNQSVNENTLVTLNGTASSDPDNDVLTYLWTAPSGITLSSNTASKPTFTSPEVATNTNYTFSLVVNDGMVNSSADQVVITVKQVNKAPVANAGPDQSVNENTLVTLNGLASSDPDNDALTYLWTAPSGITLSSNTASKPTFTSPEVATNTNYTFSLVVNDGMVNSSADQVVITVKQVNKAPVANAGPDQSVNENTLVTLNGLASSDPDNDALTYLWTAPSGITLSSNTASKPTFTSPEVATNTNYTFSLVVNDGMVNSSADQVVIMVKQVNKAPVANAGSNQSVNENTLVTLNGTASSDPDNDVLTYLWTAPSGITLSSNTASKPTFTSPEVATNTNYTFSLVVNDGMVNSSADQVVITVKQVNKAPVANAGPDQSVNENTLVTLNGLASSDPDNDALTYLWTAPSGITLSSNTASKPTFTSPEVATNTNYTFSLVVNDGSVNSTTDQVVITVKQVNKAPVANAGPDQSGTEGKLIQLDGSLSSDFENDPLTYHWTAPSGITLSSNTIAKPSFIGPAVTVNTNYTFSLVVNDGALNSSSDQVVITVMPNTAPIANAGPDMSIKKNSYFTLDGSNSYDPDGDAITYKWTAPPEIMLTSTTDAKPSFIAPDLTVSTNYTFTLVVNDGTKDSSPDQVIITVKPGNSAPIANAGNNQSVNEGVLVTLDGTASSDPDGDALNYTWVAPSGINLSSTTISKPTFTAPEVKADTDFTFSLTVYDGTVNSISSQIIVTVKQVNKAPVSNAGPDQTINENELVTLDGTASSDPDNDSLTYSWIAPPGIILSSTTSPNPTFTAPEVMTNFVYYFSLIVNDGKVNSVADVVAITVRQVNKAPVANAGPDQVVNEGEVVALNATGSYDADNNGLIYYWTAPPGITLSSITDSNPTFVAPSVNVDNIYTFYLVVNDGTLNSVTDQVTITVRHINKAPVANAGPNQSVIEGALVTLDGTASSDADNDPLTYFWTAPSGITLSSVTSPKPTFTAPQALAENNYTFSLVVNDGTINSTPKAVIITVTQVNVAPVASAGPDQSVNEGDLVTLDGTASYDPDHTALTYQWTAPPEIKLSSDTSPSPTFIAPEVMSNTNYTISLVVNDGSLNSTADQVIVNVRQINKPPVYISSNVFTAYVGLPFEFTLEALDIDNDPISFSIPGLPSFLTLAEQSNTSAILSGTFANQDMDNYPFILVVSDGTHSTQETINIHVALPVIGPYVNDSIKDITVNIKSTPEIIDLTTVFADSNPEDTLIYSVLSNTNQQVVKATVTGSQLSLSFSTIVTGSSEIVVAASSNGKEALSIFKVIVKNSTGLDFQTYTSNPEIFPNPTDGYIQVKFDDIPKTDTWITVYNPSGKMILQKIAKEKTENFNLKNYSRGIYFIRIGSQNSSKSYKIVLR